jgi:hypothetical protein
MEAWILLIGIGNVDFDPTITAQFSVPEPATLVVAAIGLALTYMTRRELLSQDS